MSTGASAGCRDKEAGAYRYQRHQPENTLLYRMVERHYPEFTEQCKRTGIYRQKLKSRIGKCGVQNDWGGIQREIVIEAG